MNEEELQEHLNRTVYRALDTALNAPRVLPRPASLIRQAYVNPSPPPTDPEQDFVYYHLVPEAAAPQVEKSRDEQGNAQLFRFAPYVLNMVFYGRHALSRAWEVYDVLYLDFSRQARQILRRGGLYPLSVPRMPYMVREELGKEHRFRVDYSVPMWIAVLLEEDSDDPDIIRTPPEIRLNTGGTDPD